MKCQACGHINERRKKATLPESDFDRFWTAYPRKTGKFLASKVWKLINGDEALIKVIIAAVNKQRRSTDWMKDNGAYIPHASTWLNQRRWDDEVPLDGKIVHLSAPQTPETQAKAQAAKDRLEAIREREFEKRELVRLAQERDDKRSQKMMESTGEKFEEDVKLAGQRWFMPNETWSKPPEAAGEKEDYVMPEIEKGRELIANFIKDGLLKIKDENGNKWIEEMERLGADGE